MIVDGRNIANDVLARTKIRAERLPHKPRVLAYVADEPNEATHSYLKIKKHSAERAGCEFEETVNPTFFTTADAAIVQLPTTEEVMNLLKADVLIPIEKDADVLSTAARQKFNNNEEGALLPPVVAAVAEIFDLNQVDTKGKRAVVVGTGFLVGAPIAVWLAQKGAEVTTLTAASTPEELSAALRAADIIVSGAGSPHLIQPDMLKDGVVLIDAGTAESSGKIAGDADPACAEKCSLFTPVPGGVGPIAVAKLFENATILAERNL